MSLECSSSSAADDSNQQLLEQARNGSNIALGELLQRYRDYLVFLADDELDTDLKVKTSASDVVQESCLEAARDFQSFAGSTPEEFQRWLRRVLLNNVANVVRSFRETEKRDVAREARLSGDQPIGSDRLVCHDTLSPSGVVAKQEQFEQLHAALGRLPEHYREVIHWRNYERLSFEDIGTHFGRTAEAVRKLWARAIECLQQELDSLNDSRKCGP